MDIDRLSPVLSRESIGNLDVDELNEHITQSIASVSSTRRRASPRVKSPDVSVDGRVRRRVSPVALFASGDHQYSRERNREPASVRISSPPPDGAKRMTQRRILPTIKLGTYDGSTSLETFLAKFENSAQYYSWSARDRLFHLKASLEGHAGHELWEITPDAIEYDVVKLLRNRFGNANHMERYRAELHTRRRKPGESMQSVY